MTRQAANAEASVTGYVAEFIAATDLSKIPADVVRLGNKSILDSLAVALSGSVAPGSRLVREYIGQQGCRGGTSTAIGASEQLPARFAALANGTAMHADDFDDSWEADTPNYQGGHPSVPVLAAVLAVAERDGRSGTQVLAAYHAGVETLCRVIDGTDVPGGARGRHLTGTCGMLGATAGAANLKKLPVEAVHRALGLAAAQAAGLHQSFGTMTKPYQAGRAAEGGVVSTDLAALGFTASSSVLDGKGGFYESESSACATERILGKLGRPWAFAETARGVRLKPWPSGSLTHPGMTKALQLIEQHDVTADDVARVTIKTSEGTFRTLLHHRPKTGLQAKFSIEFCLAALFVDRKLGLRHFNDAFVNRPDVQRIVHAVECERFSAAEAESAGYAPLTTFVTIRLKDGRSLSGRLDDGKGSLADPMTDDEVEAKFRDCADVAGWPASKVESAIETVWRLPDLTDIRELTRHFRAG